jgi:hypothetical protein
VYLDRGEYAKARKITRLMTDTKPHELVLKREAEKFIKEKKLIIETV